MQARPAQSANRPRRIDADRYFDHRRATGGAIEMLVGPDLQVLWLSAASLSEAARKAAFTLGADRLILANRRDEDRLTAFLDGLDQSPGVWALEVEDERWIIHAEPITPPETARAWLLTWRPMEPPAGHLWADVGAALKLTAAETRMMMLLLDGAPVAEAARRQSITVETARTHVRRIYAKTGATNRGQLFAIALPYRWG